MRLIQIIDPTGNRQMGIHGGYRPFEFGTMTDRFYTEYITFMPLREDNIRELNLGIGYDEIGEREEYSASRREIKVIGEI